MAVSVDSIGVAAMTGTSPTAMTASTCFPAAFLRFNSFFSFFCAFANFLAAFSLSSTTTSTTSSGAGEGDCEDADAAFSLSSSLPNSPPPPFFTSPSTGTAFVTAAVTNPIPIPPVAGNPIARMLPIPAPPLAPIPRLSDFAMGIMEIFLEKARDPPCVMSSCEAANPSEGAAGVHPIDESNLYPGAEVSAIIQSGQYSVREYARGRRELTR